MYEGISYAFFRLFTEGSTTGCGLGSGLPGLYRGTVLQDVSCTQWALCRMLNVYKGGGRGAVLQNVAGVRFPWAVQFARCRMCTGWGCVQWAVCRMWAVYFGQFTRCGLSAERKSAGCRLCTLDSLQDVG